VIVYAALTVLADDGQTVLATAERREYVPPLAGASFEETLNLGKAALDEISADARRAMSRQINAYRENEKRQPGGL
jgi:hypothetical protein